MTATVFFWRSWDYDSEEMIDQSINPSGLSPMEEISFYDINDDEVTATGDLFQHAWDYDFKDEIDHSINPAEQYPMEEIIFSDIKSIEHAACNTVFADVDAIDDGSTASVLVTDKICERGANNKLISNCAQVKVCLSSRQDFIKYCNRKYNRSLSAILGL
jgi:hypothetical protein